MAEGRFRCLDNPPLRFGVEELRAVRFRTGFAGCSPPFRAVLSTRAFPFACDFFFTILSLRHYARSCVKTKPRIGYVRSAGFCLACDPSR